MPPRPTRRPAFDRCSAESPPRNSGAHDPLFSTALPLPSGPTVQSGAFKYVAPPPAARPPPPVGALPPDPSSSSHIAMPASSSSTPASASPDRVPTPNPTPITHAFLASPFASSTPIDSSNDGHDGHDSTRTTTDDSSLSSTELSSTSTMNLNRRHAVTIEPQPQPQPQPGPISTVTTGTANALPPPRPPGAGGPNPIPPTPPVQAQEGPPKANAPAAPPKKAGSYAYAFQALYTFPSPPPDSSDIVSELQEFYSYVEVPQVIDHKDSFLAWWDRPHQAFIDVPQTEQLEVIHSLLDGLASPDPDARFTVARHLLYVAQGTFASSTCPDHHLELIQANCALLRNAKALDAIWDAVKKTGERWERVSHLPNTNPVANDPSSSSDVIMLNCIEFDEERHRQEQLDEINSELALLLAVLYFMMEVHRGNDDWAEELMQLDPPAPIYLFNLVAGLRERNAKGYPVKKLLLLLWKSILACIGGQSDIPRVRALVRSIEGLEPNPSPAHKPAAPQTRPSPPSPFSSSSSTCNMPSSPTDSVIPDARSHTKVAPTDIVAFNSEMTSKYPSYIAPPLPINLPIPIEMERIAAAAAPQPVRPTFSYPTNPNHDPTILSNQSLSSQQAFSGPGQQGGGMQNSALATPAPTPPTLPAPPPPKPKKQQYQTDQSKPFVLPFAPSNSGIRSTSTSSTTTFGARIVPRSIEEAGQLYASHLRLSTELWQSWKVREEFLYEETGIAQAERLAAKNGQVDQVEKKALGGLKERMRDLSVLETGKELNGLDESAIDGSDEGEEDQASGFKKKEQKKGPFAPDPLEMLRKMEREVTRLAMEERDQEKRNELEDKSKDLKRLMRIEMLYRAVLPQMQSAVIVLLKLLLATVTANNNNQNQGAGNAESEQLIEPSLEDTDIMRHREITSKAVSAILILALKWFKTSHVMKFHYLSQLLVDSNCLLLILKMFGLQEVVTSVTTKNDRADQNFFKFCDDIVNPADLSDSKTYGGRRPRPRSPSRDSSSDCDSNSSTRAQRGTGRRTKSVTTPVSLKVGSTTTPAPTIQEALKGAQVHDNNSAEDDQVVYITDYSWRNFFSVINFVHILQKLTKRKTHRVLLLVQYKSSAILKRILKVSHPTLRLYVLKVIKSQVPYCGRKWRQSNMKVITAIYLHCRPDLRDEWLTGIDVDHDVEESLPHEQALRALVRFFNTKHYGSYAPQLHRRSSVTSPGNDFAASRGGVEGGNNVGGYGPGTGGGGGPPSPGIGGAGLSHELNRPLLSSSSNDDIFPPSRPITSFNFDHSDPSSPTSRGHALLSPTSPPLSRYPTDYPSNLDDYADYEVDDLLLYPRPIDEAGYLFSSGGDVLDPLEASRADWERLGQLVGQYDEDISDSESVGSLRSLLGFERGEGGEGEEGSDDGVSEFELEEERMDERQRKAIAVRNEWEHISPETITALEEERAAALPHSPRPSRRRSSTGPISPALRPVLIDRDDDSALESSGGNAVDEGGDAGAGGAGNAEPNSPHPAPTAPHQGPAVDEVELVFGE